MPSAAMLEVPLQRRPRIVNVSRLRMDLEPPRVYRIADWALVLVEYYGSATVGDRYLPLRPEHVLLLPPDTPRRFQTDGHSQHRAIHFAWGPVRGPQPLLLDAGAASRRLRDDCDEILLCWHTRPVQAAVRLWDMLWRLCTLPALDGIVAGVVHPAVRRALGLIEPHLGETLSVAAIARQVELSHNQLTRLFKRELGCTPVRWIRRCRMQQAAHLLRHSNLPVKDIAARVGLPDLQQFNRCAHAEWSCSPRQLRADTAPG